MLLSPMPLLTSPLVRPLSEDWRETLDTLARARGWPTSREPERLAVCVANLSEAYNAEGQSAALRTPEALAARLGFSFPRDVPKAAGAIRELLATGLLRMPSDRPLRILDLGAGLGASSWGVSRALEALGAPSAGRIESTCIDDDTAALGLAAALAHARSGRPPIELAIEPVRASIAQGLSRVKGPFDLVLLGQVLSELGSQRDPERLERHASLVRSSLEAIAPHGSVVIIEPALRDRTRHLHALRDTLVGQSSAKVTVFAPCVHDAPCPALAEEGQWCHEDLDVDLPVWLGPVARGAGLRWQGLTFSYLVLRKDGRSLRTSLAETLSPAALVRVVSGAIATKGKREAFVCGELERDGTRVLARARAMRLDRDANESNRKWHELARGDLLACDPPLDATKPRIRQGSRLTGATPKAER